MELPSWVLWTVATLLAVFPLSVLLIPRLAGRNDSSKAECNADKAAWDESWNELELYAIVHMMATVQMTQYYDKDIRRID